AVLAMKCCEYRATVLYIWHSYAKAHVDSTADRRARFDQSFEFLVVYASKIVQEPLQCDLFQVTRMLESARNLLWLLHNITLESKAREVSNLIGVLTERRKNAVGDVDYRTIDDQVRAYVDAVK